MVSLLCHVDMSGLHSANQDAPRQTCCFGTDAAGLPARMQQHGSAVALCPPPPPPPLSLSGGKLRQAKSLQWPSKWCPDTEAHAWLHRPRECQAICQSGGASRMTGSSWNAAKKMVAQPTVPRGMQRSTFSMLLHRQAAFPSLDIYLEGVART